VAVTLGGFEERYGGRAIAYNPGISGETLIPVPVRSKDSQTLSDRLYPDLEHLLIRLGLDLLASGKGLPSGSGHEWEKTSHT